MVGLVSILIGIVVLLSTLCNTDFRKYPRRAYKYFIGGSVVSALGTVGLVVLCIRILF